MILFSNDWQNYPHAIPHLSTKNSSWLRISGVLKVMGVRNHMFLLALHNPMLENVDPYDPNLTNEQIVAIVMEAKENPWYFFREILRLPITGSPENVRFRATRANISLMYLFYNHVTTLLIQPRQTGKSSAADAINIHTLCVSGLNTTIGLLTKDDALRVTNIKRIKDIIDGLPFYFKLKSKSDTYSGVKLTINRLGNVYQTAVAQSSIGAAAKLGRGMSMAITQIDELAFITNLQTTLSSMLASGGAARDAAKANGQPYGTMFTTTAGYLSSESGRYAYKIYNECLPWSETLYDAPNEEELHAAIRKNSVSGRLYVLCEFNHRQLGYTDQWLREKMEEAYSKGENAEAEFLNIWPAGNEASPISKEHLNLINSSLISDPISIVYTYGYIIRWYVPQTELDNKLATRKLVAGLDTSDAVGNDDIALCIRDVRTGEVVGCGLYNETNLIQFANWITDFLVEYPNITLVPERKSSGVVIIDNLLLILPYKGINPFRRIFNWVVNDMDTNKQYNEDLRYYNSKKSEEIINKYRKLFGYATSSSGRSSRDNLYGLTFNATIRYTSRLMRDKMLIRQLNGLIRKNDRIDHKEGETDDLVVSTLLAHWLLIQGKNLSYYNIPTNLVLQSITDSIIEEQGGPEAVKHKAKQQQIIKRLESMFDELKSITNSVQKELMVNKIRYVARDLDESSRATFNIETLIENINKVNTYNRQIKPKISIQF